MDATPIVDAATVTQDSCEIDLLGGNNNNNDNNNNGGNFYLDFL